MSKNIAIIFAGGSGVRMGSEKPKQFIEVEGKPIIIHTLNIFENHPSIDEIYIACKKDCINELIQLIKINSLTKIKNIVPGGNTGMGSIYNGLKAARENNDGDAIVLIHDGVRPIVSMELIDKVLEQVNKTKGVVTCTPMYETPVISKSGSLVEETPKRDECYTAQAPQAFYLEDILSAHETVRRDNPDYNGIVDSCTLMRRMGDEVSIVKGPRSNIKVTTPEDLYIFKAMLEYEREKQI